jgi:hypothetical protein
MPSGDRSASLVTPELGAGIERLGFGVLWLGSSPAGDLVGLEYTNMVVTCYFS